MFSILIGGGPVMIPIALSAVIATVIIIERLIFYSGIKKGERDLLPRIRASIDKGHYDEAAAICDTVESPVSRLMKTGIAYRDFSEASIKEAVMNQANREIPRLERYLSTLGTVANIATLLGLLGTVTGNIQAFGVLGDMGSMGNPAVLAGAISEALVTTATGLIVSIPAIIFYNYFIAEVNRMVTEMEASVSDLVLLLVAEKKKHEV
ncbi:MotA/TolQ/ExbB proton channel family protein [Treponema zuelzerae]|uniref:MotA/TolQ/ExbB proton channel family protein n=1 Tax=Teretinema zuelzerae TaxID=156 RepID=A0AAE3EKX2_9SPIR|nr:MotA/TolQ/ExbB proton channel family protein [Teretinema zuelzerae]MBN2811781.1 MotA/TolQ/ExbB proton channel family protein [Spirochaetales bacterium]MCD1655403.1 MotA/TolQ/ExbB proton channel family protein [Teretinema zuelzerae]HPO01898.1 MotA/TolQ/ExbB proton channel family protein [Treponemataceae bacterium]